MIASEALFLANHGVAQTKAQARYLATLRALTYICANCGDSFAHHEIDTSTGLCTLCYEKAGLENEHQDGHHDGAPNANCPMCKEELT